MKYIYTTILLSIAFIISSTAQTNTHATSTHHKTEHVNSHITSHSRNGWWKH